MRSDQLDYYKSLGAHIKLLREARGMTQGELAQATGVSQQAIFAYEIADRRPSIYILTKICKVFAVSLQDMVGFAKPTKVPNRRLSPRATRHAQRLMALSKTQQRFVVRIIDLLEYGKVRWNANQHSRKAA